MPRNPDAEPTLPGALHPVRHGNIEGGAPSADQRDRQAQLLTLRSKAPLRSSADQQDASDLGLFKAANEPTLF